MGKTVHECLFEITRRAEKASDEKLAETFVDAAPLLASISTVDNQLILGRRGSGKTHVLKYLNKSTAAKGGIAVYMDLRSIGSNGSIYNDQSKTHAQRATPLLLDVLQGLHEELLRVAVDLSEEVDLSKAGPRLDDLANSISEVEVVGPIESLSEISRSSRVHTATNIGAGIATGGASASAVVSDAAEEGSSSRSTLKQSGTQSYYVKFGDVQSKLNKLLELFGKRRIWMLLDEWSEVPIDIQPYLADLLRRCIFPLTQVTVKIAAIEHRTNLIIQREKEYVGLELGADLGADVNLDDFMVFDNDAERSMAFFSNLLFKHYRATDDLDPAEGPQTPDDFVSAVFTQRPAFEEFVRATEGVPRDAVYLASMLARRAFNKKFTVPNVRTSARDWFQQDKSKVLKSNQPMAALLEWIIVEVIGHRKARAFLLESTQRHDLIDGLFDLRLLHVLKKSVSSHDAPGVRYDVYKLDYGCYVDLITTTKAPGGLLPADTDAGFVEVPPDDYRAIRRAILDLGAFGKSTDIESGAPGEEPLSDDLGPEFDPQPESGPIAVDAPPHPNPDTHSPNKPAVAPRSPGADARPTRQ